MNKKLGAAYPYFPGLLLVTFGLLVAAVPELLVAIISAALLACIMHETPAATADLDVLPGVLGSRTLRRTEQVRLRSEPLWLPGGTTISTISLRRLVHNAG